MGGKITVLLKDIFAVIGRDLYGEIDPSRYGNLGKAVFTLFQLITLENWFEMYSDVNPGTADEGQST